MRIRDGLLVVMLAGCTINLDPRDRPIALVQRDGHGGWIVVDRIRGEEVGGELISVAPDELCVLDGAALVTVPRGEIWRAELWAWETGKGALTIWGVLGSASTISHGFYLLFSLPAWVITTAITASHESKSSRLLYPDDDRWEALVKWARFPQGLPAGVDAAALVHQDRR